MKIAILEDNIAFQYQILDQLDPHDDLIHVYSDIESYDLTNITYDLLLLDIHIHQENGIDYIRKHENKQTFIIYISNYEEYIIDAFDSNVLGFIPKRNLKQLLISKVQYAKEKIQAMNHISFSIVGGKIDIKENDIIKIYLQEGNLYLLLENNQKYRLTYETLKSAQQHLPEYFIRVNNSEVINPSKIRTLMNKDHSILLTNNQVIAVSRRKWRTIKSKYISNQLTIS